MSRIYLKIKIYGSINCWVCVSLTMFLSGFNIPPPLYNIVPLSLFFVFLDLLCSLSVYLICFQGSQQLLGH